MTLAGWLVAINLLTILISATAIGISLFVNRRNKQRLEEFKRANEDLDRRLRDTVATAELLLDDDPSDADAERMLREALAAADSTGRGGVRTEVEQGAANRILGTAGAGSAGKSAGG